MCQCEGCSCSQPVSPIDQLVAAAVKIEKAGRSFYSNLAIKEYNEKIKDVLISLARDEENHVEAFARLGEALKNDEEFAARCGTADYSEYLDAIIKAHVFYRPLTDDDDYVITSARDTLEMALRFERDSIIFFQELRSAMGKEGRELLDMLIDQEKMHIRKISHQFDRV